MKLNELKKNNKFTFFQKLIVVVFIFYMAFLLYNEFVIRNTNNNELKGWSNFSVKNTEIFLV